MESIYFYFSSLMTMFRIVIVIVTVIRLVVVAVQVHINVDIVVTHLAMIQKSACLIVRLESTRIIKAGVVVVRRPVHTVPNRRQNVPTVLTATDKYIQESVSHG